MSRRQYNLPIVVDFFPRSNQRHNGIVHELSQILVEKIHQPLPRICCPILDKIASACLFILNSEQPLKESRYSVGVNESEMRSCLFAYTYCNKALEGS